VFGGNGYLSVYIAGIILGNSRIPNKTATIHFFDGNTLLMAGDELIINDTNI